MNSTAMLLGMVKLKTADVVECMIFDYGQEHAEEIDYARSLCDKLGVPSSLWSFEPGPLMDVGPAHARVPVDVEVNPLHLYSHMLNCAAYRARDASAQFVSAGFIEDEASFGWDDIYRLWRGVRIFSGQCNVLTSAADLDVPLWAKTKAEVFKFIEDIDCVAEVLRDTMSCLRGNTELMHPWGYGCGSCDGCVRRWKAWEEHLHNKSP
jgi:7-cyano-7-deazaguanine synthase in queuosine biosynthesis